MSYNTDFSLSIIQGSIQLPPSTHHRGPTNFCCAQCGPKIDSIEVLDRAVELLKAMNDGYDVLDEPCSWYEHEDHMCEVSKQLPEIVFALYGNCDDYHELWVKYFFNGQMQVEDAVITYGEFDKSKLR